jgi:hypothetical protein
LSGRLYDSQDAADFLQVQAQMKVLFFITDFSVVDRIINHLKLTFVADKPAPARIAYQEVLMAAESSVEYL